MRSSLSLLRATGLAQGSLLQQAAAPVASSSSCLLHGLAGPQRDEGAAPTPASRTLPSVASLLVTSSLATAAPRSSTSASGVPALVRSLAHFAGPEPPGTSVENWAKFRAAFNSEKKNSLGPAYYAMILVFGFFHSIVHVHEFPPRVLAAMVLTFVMLYVRRTSFSLGP